MSVTKKNQPAWAGIVVTGSTRQDAVNNYSQVALGNDVAVLASSDNSWMLATASAQADTFLNPLMDTEESMVALEQDFEVTASNSDDGQDIVSVAHTICSDGCGTHIIADDPESVSHCPECNAAVDFDQELEDDLESDSMDDIENELDGDQGIVVAASTFEEAQTLYRETLQNPSEALSFQSESGVSFVSHASCDINTSPFDGEDVDAEDLDSESFSHLTSMSSSLENIDVHYFNCFSSECGAHVLSSSEDTTLCPSCSSGLIDPEDLAEMEEAVLAMDSSMDEDDDEDLDLDDDIDEDELEEDEEEDEDEDDFELVSGSDDFELLSGSDEDEDEDEADEDDDELDGLEDEEDEDLEDEDDDMESDSASDESVVSVSEINAMSVVANSTEGGLQPEQLSLVNCSSVNGTATWLAFHGSTPIATSLATNVSGAVAKIFGTPAFATAVQKAVSLSGVEKGLEEFGFKAVAFDTETMNIAVSNSIIAEAQNKVATFEEAQSNRDAVLMERLGAALATSMMGLDREVFAGKSNPIIHALSSALNAAGVSNARDLVDSVFEANATAYNKLITEQVKTLLSKSADTQNELAQMVASSSYARKGHESSSSSIENRLSGRTVPSVNLKSDEQISSESSATKTNSFAALAKASIGRAFNS